MNERLPRPLVVALSIGIASVLLGCTGHGEADVNPAENGYEPPASGVDVGYADAVAAALGRAEVEAWGGAARRVALDDQLRGDLAAVFGEEGAENRIVSLEQNGGVEQIIAEPEGQPYRATRLLEVRENCLVVEGEADFSVFLRNEATVGSRPAQFVLRLQGDRAGGNPTPWQMTGFLRSPEEDLSCESVGRRAAGPQGQ